MTFQQYDVIGAMMNKGKAWEERLSSEDIEGVKQRLRSEAQEGDVSLGATDVAHILAGAFHDDHVAERLMLESMGRFGAFDHFINDVRLRPGSVLPDPEILDQARDLYNAVLAMRLGLQMTPDGDFVWQDPSTSVPARAASWAKALPDFQVEELVETAGVAVYPKDLLVILEPFYDRAEILKPLIKQSVEEVRPLAEFLQELREWGQLEHLDAATMVRSRHSYHALIAAGLNIDMAAEMDRRGGALNEQAGIIEVLSAHYSRPDRIKDALEASISSGDSLATFLAKLSSEGELGQLHTHDFARIRADYEGLVRAPDTHRGPQDPALEQPIVGAWTRKVGNPNGSRGAAYSPAG